jgi:hypothetical protein
VQLGVIFPRAIQPPNELADARAIQIRDVAKIEQNAPPAVLEQIDQQGMNGFAFDHREATADIHDRYISELPSARAESHSMAP